MTPRTPITGDEVADVVYPASQEEARLADYWRFHYGSGCPANCDEIYYRRECDPETVYGPTKPELIRWTRLRDGTDILAWHPVYAHFQRALRSAATAARQQGVGK